VRNTGEKLGEALAMLLDILHPERIIIGGLALRLRRLLFDPALAVMRREALSQTADACLIIPAKLGERILRYLGTMCRGRCFQ
jgi:glucokinase